VLFFILVCSPGCQSTSIDHHSQQETALNSSNTADDRIDWWREARFGLFIHWGLYSLPAGVWDGETRHAEWIRTTAQIPLETYDNFIHQFNPKQFDPDAWAMAAEEAGMQYIVITTKHHDGFCLFSSEETDFDIDSAPYPGDIMAEIATAFRKRGLKIGWYHSIMDWHHPDYLPRRGWEEDRPSSDADFDRYRAYLHAQITELLTQYGPIDILWFDGEWESTWRHEFGRELYALCRSLQPRIIVNNRVDVGRGGMADIGTPHGSVGDFGTPEQNVPAEGIPGVDWESCITMNRHWGYNQADQDYKSSTELIRLLVDIASKGGNLLLNIGPTAEGSFPKPSLARLTAIGNWIDTYGESIYGTQASPFGKIPAGRVTWRPVGKNSLFYLHLFESPGEVLTLTSLGNRPLRAAWLHDPESKIPLVHDHSGIHLEIGSSLPDNSDSVITLEVAGSPIIYRAPTISSLSSMFITTRETTIESGSPHLQIRYTSDGSEPSLSSPIYSVPLVHKESLTIRASSFHQGRAVTPITSYRVEKVRPHKAQSTSKTKMGLIQRLYLGNWDEVPDFRKLSPTQTAICSTVGLEEGLRREFIAVTYDGWIEVPETGVYQFALESDDGSKLWIGSQLVVDNDGLHGAKTLRSTVPLEKGKHSIHVEYFNKTGGAVLDLRVGIVGDPLAPLIPKWLSHN